MWVKITSPKQEFEAGPLKTTEPLWFHIGTPLCKEALHRDNRLPCLVPSPDPATNTHVSGHSQAFLLLQQTNRALHSVFCDNTSRGLFFFFFF